MTYVSRKQGLAVAGVLAGAAVLEIGRRRKKKSAVSPYRNGTTIKVAGLGGRINKRLMEIPGPEFMYEVTLNVQDRTIELQVSHSYITVLT